MRQTLRRLTWLQRNQDHLNVTCRTKREKGKTLQTHSCDVRRHWAQSFFSFLIQSFTAAPALWFRDESDVWTHLYRIGSIGGGGWSRFCSLQSQKKWASKTTGSKKPNHMLLSLNWKLTEEHSGDFRACGLQKTAEMCPNASAEYHLPLPKVKEVMS